MRVGHSLSSCTIRIDYAVINSSNSPFLNLEGCRVSMVDTPGFDDTYESDVQILQRISKWLEISYRDPKAVLAGVIYLHDISHDRFNNTDRKNLEIFNHLCGNAALDKVILGTTKWQRVTTAEGESREARLTTEFWKPMIDKGSQVRRFQHSQESALEFIEDILRRVVSNDILAVRKKLVSEERLPEERVTNAVKVSLNNVLAIVEELAKILAETNASKVALNNVLAIQKELVDEGKSLVETNAGKVALMYAVQQKQDIEKALKALKAELANVRDPEVRAKLEQLRERKEALEKDMKALKVHWARRLSRFLCII